MGQEDVIACGYTAAEQDHWGLERWQHEYRMLWAAHRLALNTIESLQRHEAEIMAMVGWLRANAPERFDPSGRHTMADIMTGLGADYIMLRNRSWLERIWRWLEGRAESRRQRKRERLHELDEED